MTRIISGRLRGRTLSVPPAGTRPTTDRVREALFSAIASRVDLDGAAALDLFAGSGALGLEAVSRGADTAWFVEENPRAVACLKKNVDGVITTVPSAIVKVRRAKLPGALAGPCPVAGGFDLVLIDPPYAASETLDVPVLTALHDGGWLADDALVVWERSKRDREVSWPETYAVEFQRTYGETTVEMARPGSPERLLDGAVDTVTS